LIPARSVRHRIGGVQPSCCGGAGG
jgi:hypothetical protein